MFESLVQSGLLPPRGFDHNRNQSSQFQKMPKTEPDHNRPVLCSFLRLQDWSLTGLLGDYDYESIYTVTTSRYIHFSSYIKAENSLSHLRSKQLR